MKGLYDQDFTVLTPEEEQEKERIDAEGNAARKTRFGQKNMFHYYPEAVRRYYASLFPNNFMDFMLLRDEKVLNAQCDGFEALLNDKSISELDIKRYIQNNKYYHLPASIFSNYTFGHHEAVLFKEFPLGTQYVVDYLLADRASGGWQFIFVEFENPYNNIVVKDGDWGMTVRKGLKQIRDWQAYIAANYAVLYEEFKKYTPKVLPEEFLRYDPTRMHYAVVAGRRQDFDDPTIRVLQRQLEKESDIKLLHYDNLLDDSRRLIGMSSY